MIIIRIIITILISFIIISSSSFMICYYGGRARGAPRAADQLAQAGRPVAGLLLLQQLLLLLLLLQRLLLMTKITKYFRTGKIHVSISSSKTSFFAQDRISVESEKNIELAQATRSQAARVCADVSCPRSAEMCVCVYIYIYMYMVMCVYIQRDRERERDTRGACFHEYLQEAGFVLTDISESLRKPPGVFGRM